MPPPQPLELVVDPVAPSFTSRRSFDAPRALVFDAFTSRELLERWMGARTRSLVSCENDPRVGGRHRFVHRTEGGQEFGFRGEYREITPPERLVRTFVFEPMPHHEALETVMFDERDGKTIVTTTTLHETVAARDGHLADGRMQAGVTDAYARLDGLLAALQAR